MIRPSLLPLVLSPLLSFAVAQGASRLPPPAAGAYRCTVTTWTIRTPLALNQKYDVFSNSVYTELSPTVTGGVNITLSPLGILTLDGKGKYTQTNAGGKVTGRGRYTYDAAHSRPAFKGPLAGGPFRLEGYTVNSDGDFALYFTLGQARHVCALRVRGNPLPQRAQANGPLTGRLTVSGASAQEYDLVTGQAVQNTGDGGTSARLPGGFGAYATYDALRQEGHVEFRSGKGTALRPALTLPMQGPYVALNAGGTRLLANVAIAGQITPDNPFGAMDTTSGWGLYDAAGKLLAMTPEDYLNTAIHADAVPAFLPDGQVLIPEGSGRILLYSKDLQRARPFAQGRMPAVSPDGQRVAFLGGGEAVILTTPSGQEVGRLTIPDGIEVLALAFSPDSRFLAFVIRTSPISTYLASASVTGHDLQWLENRSGEAIRLPPGAGQGVRLSWWTGQPALPPAWKAGPP